MALGDPPGLQDEPAELQDEFPQLQGELCWITLHFSGLIFELQDESL